MAHLPAADQRHPWLRYQVKGYTEGIIHSYEQRLETIWSRPVNQVHVLDFKGLTPRMRQDLAVRLRMVYTREGQQVFVSHAWRRLFRIRAPLVREFILYWVMLGGGWHRDNLFWYLDYTLSRRWQRQGLEPTRMAGPAPSYVLIRDPVRRLCHKMIAYSFSGREQTPEKEQYGDLAETMI
ncbi:hypothetical protein Tco_1441093, partial [Tanacetum coccineum]